MPIPIFSWRRTMIFSMWICDPKVGTKPKKVFKNSFIYNFWVCIIYDIQWALVEFLVHLFLSIPFVYFKFENNGKNSFSYMHRMKYESYSNSMNKENFYTFPFVGDFYVTAAHCIISDTVIFNRQLLIVKPRRKSSPTKI